MKGFCAKNLECNCKRLYTARIFFINRSTFKLTLGSYGYFPLYTQFLHFYVQGRATFCSFWNELLWFRWQPPLLDSGEIERHIQFSISVWLYQHKPTSTLKRLLRGTSRLLHLILGLAPGILNHTSRNTADQPPRLPIVVGDGDDLVHGLNLRSPCIIEWWDGIIILYTTKKSRHLMYTH